MDVVRGWREAPSSVRGGALAIGNFDGVHRGHQAVLDVAISGAREQGLPAGAMVFEPHPRQFFQPGKPIFRLTPLDIKLKLFASHGLNFTVIIDFDEALANLSAADFATQVLAEALAPSLVVTGYDFFFGKGRGGNPAILRQLGADLGFAVETVAPAGDSGEIFSSTRVREMLAEGDARGTTHILGRCWRVSGVVKPGAGRGAGLGFPTANIDLEEGQALKHGIYAVRVHRDSEAFDGAAYLGPRPTFDNGAPVLEVFLLDFSGDLYGCAIEVEFVDFIRGDGKFRSGESLSEQMAKDCARAREILSHHQSF
ncbi:MAG: bifunctional riboflavin kinase/FAD synthetase [Hyphomicrobiales bacterium]|nr:bifunctional riboflavin kinase/FAD synthetase [Hyphomicrobiales bacterium]